MKKWQFKCIECGKVDLLNYKAFWYRKNKGTGKCYICSHKNINSGSFGKGLIPWNKGLNISGMSGKKQSDYQKQIKREMNFKDNPSKRPEVKEKMKLAKLGKIGELANNWQGGKTKGQRERHLKKYQDWRLNIFKRDSWTCQNCEQTGGNLIVHHIKSWAKYLELRYNLNNGITLCNYCHHKVHSKN